MDRRRRVRWPLWAAMAGGGVTVMLIATVYYYVLPFLAAAIQPLLVQIDLRNESGAPIAIEHMFFDGKALEESVRLEGTSLGDSSAESVTIGYDEWSKRGRLKITLKRQGQAETEEHVFRLNPKFGASWCFFDVHIRARSVDVELTKCIFF